MNRSDFPKLQVWLQEEAQRQAQTISLIASENYTHPQIMAMQGSVLTNKYAEGYPGHRYYPGCCVVDKIEELAIGLACELFGVDYANVQPHSGSQANAAVFLALMKPGDTFLAMGLACGGHLTHGSPVSFSSKFYKPVHYGVNREGWIDLDEVRKLALEHRPKVIIAGYSAYPRPLDWAGFRAIADEVGAYLWADIAHIAGLIAGGVMASPFPHAHVATSTTQKTLAGPRGGLILAKGQSESFNKKLNACIFPGSQGGPLQHVIAAKAVCFYLALQPAFKTYAQNVVRNAQAFAETLSERGVECITGGTENHIVLLDLSERPLTGRQVAMRLEAAHMLANQNAIPGEKRSFFETSGIRIGTPAMTTRGMGVQQSQKLAHWVVDLIKASEDELESTLSHVRKGVLEMCQRFPIAFDPL